jgi:ribose 5-phosphate isomerase
MAPTKWIRSSTWSRAAAAHCLREKLVAQATTREIIVVDESKLSPRLGTKHVLPIEVLPFGGHSQVRFLAVPWRAYVVIRQTPTASNTVPTRAT